MTRGTPKHQGESPPTPTTASGVTAEWRAWLEAEAVGTKLVRLSRLPIAQGEQALNHVLALMVSRMRSGRSVTNPRGWCKRVLSRELGKLRSQPFETAGQDMESLAEPPGRAIVLPLSKDDLWSLAEQREPAMLSRLTEAEASVYIALRNKARGVESQPSTSSSRRDARTRLRRIRQKLEGFCAALGEPPEGRVGALLFSSTAWARASRSR